MSIVSLSGDDQPLELVRPQHRQRVRKAAVEVGLAREDLGDPRRHPEGDARRIARIGLADGAMQSLDLGREHRMQDRRFGAEQIIGRRKAQPGACGQCGHRETLGPALGEQHPRGMHQSLAPFLALTCAHAAGRRRSRAHGRRAARCVLHGATVTRLAIPSNRLRR